MVTLDEDRQHAWHVRIRSRHQATSPADSTLPNAHQDLRHAAKRIPSVRQQAEQLGMWNVGDDDISVNLGSGGKRWRRCAKSLDCVVLDLRLPDMSGFEVLEAIRDDGELRDLPVVVFTGKELTTEEDSRLKNLARSVVVKGVESPERLLDETSLFLHRVVSDLPPESSACLNGCTARTVLMKKWCCRRLDVRNTSALSSVLERQWI